VGVPDRARCRSVRTAGIGAMPVLAVAFAAVVPALAPRTARANGAFPDSQSILTPSSRPSEISLVTNFGLVASRDGGHTWLWSCEQDANSFGYLYQYNAAPQNRLFALAKEKLIFSDDATCGWSTAQGMITGLSATDFFPDPGDASRVLALALDPTSSTYVVLQSTDTGATFTSKLYTSDAKATMTGIEIARSDPKTIYVTLTAATTNAPMLGHSNDGGATWRFTDLTPVLGAGTPSIIGVDPTNAQSVLLLFKATTESLALTQDGGKTVTSSMTTSGYFTSATRADRSRRHLHAVRHSAAQRARDVDAWQPDLRRRQRIQRWLRAGRVDRRRADLAIGDVVRPRVRDPRLRQGGLPDDLRQ
jgi:hypothetical protein